MTITEVSGQYGLSKDTLRYYERIGLLPSIRRNGNGIRDYVQADCDWIGFIKCMRNAGLPIDVLMEYVTLFRQGDATIEARKALLIEQRTQLAAKIEEMQQTMARLDCKIEDYELVIVKKERGLKAFQSR